MAACVNQKNLQIMRVHTAPSAESERAGRLRPFECRIVRLHPWTLAAQRPRRQRQSFFFILRSLLESWDLLESSKILHFGSVTSRLSTDHSLGCILSHNPTPLTLITSPSPQQGESWGMRRPCTDWRLVGRTRSSLE